MPYSCSIESKQLGNCQPFLVNFSIHYIALIIGGIIRIFRHRWTFDWIFKSVNSNPNDITDPSHGRLIQFPVETETPVRKYEFSKLPEHSTFVRTKGIPSGCALIPNQKSGNLVILLTCILSILLSVCESLTTINGAPMNQPFQQYHPPANLDRYNRPRVLMPPYDLGFRGQTSVDNRQRTQEQMWKNDRYQSDQTPGSEWEYDQHGMQMDSQSDNRFHAYLSNPNLQKPPATMNLLSRTPLAAPDIRAPYNWDVRQSRVNPAYPNPIPNYPISADQPKQVGQYYSPWSIPQQNPYPANFLPWQSPQASRSKHPQFESKSASGLQMSGGQLYQPPNYPTRYGRVPWNNYVPESLVPPHQPNWYIMPQNPIEPDSKSLDVEEQNFVGHPSKYKDITQDEVQRHIEAYHEKNSNVQFKLPPLGETTDKTAPNKNPTAHNKPNEGLFLHGSESHDNILNNFRKMVSNWPMVNVKFLFDEIDMDNDGMINLEELHNFLLLHEVAVLQ